jgi:hypothetical protein
VCADGVNAPERSTAGKTDYQRNWIPRGSKEKQYFRVPPGTVCLLCLLFLPALLCYAEDIKYSRILEYMEIQNLFFSIFKIRNVSSPCYFEKSEFRLIECI